LVLAIQAGGPPAPPTGPLGLPERLPTPADNPWTAERAELGRRLFFDPVLSLDRSVACATCHRPERGFADDEPLSTGIAGQLTLRNAPSLQNRAFGRHFTWDGRFAALEEQVLQPIQNEREMALGVDLALERLEADATYPQAFRAAFDDGLTRANLARALAAFVRTLTTGGSPVDRFRALGEHAALEPLERTGLWIYEGKGGCWRCHSGPNFTDEAFHNTGVGALDGTPEEGRFAVTADEHDRGRFKTPTLRGLSLSAPYMHDGSLATLADVVAFYRRGGNPNDALDPALRPLELTDEEARALVAFLEALTENSP
jgi:cytochrome c peroxidase